MALPMYAPVPALIPGANRPSLNLAAQPFKPLQQQGLLISSITLRNSPSNTWNHLAYSLPNPSRFAAPKNLSYFYQEQSLSIESEN